MKVYGPDTVTIRRAPLVTDLRDNSQYRDWANADLIVIRHCMVEPYRMAEKLNSEDNVDREFAATSIRIFAATNTQIEYTDRLTVDTFGYTDFEFVVLGLPGVWHDLQGKRVYTGIIARALLG